MNVLVLAAYAVGVSAMLGAGAWLIDRALTLLRLPARGIWAAALILSIGLPLVSVSRATDAGSGVATAGVVEHPGSPAVPGDPVGLFDEGASGPTLLEPLLTSLSTAVVSASDWVTGGLGSLVGRIPRHRPLEIALAVGWAAASLAIALGFATSGWTLRRRAKGWPLETRLGHRVRTSPDLGPATVGILDPVIVIPAWARDLPTAELELILRHEHEHVRSRDTLLLAVGLATAVVCPWNPLVWWQFRKLRDAVEVDCDRRVLGAGIASASYGHLLVSIASRRGTHSSLVPTIAGSPSLLERRLTIMKNRKGRIALARALTASAAGVLLVAVACTTDVPVAVDANAGSAQSASGTPASADPADPSGVVVGIDEAGTVRVNGAAHPVDGVVDAAAASVSGDAMVTIDPHPSAPFGVVADVTERLAIAGLLPITIEVAEIDPAAPPPGMSEMAPVAHAGAGELDSRNRLFFRVTEEGYVTIRRGSSQNTQMITPAQVAGIVRQELLGNPALIGVVEVTPEASYERVMSVVEGIQLSGLNRLSMQMLD